MPAQGAGVDNAKMTVRDRVADPRLRLGHAAVPRRERRRRADDGTARSASPSRGPTNFEQVTVSESPTGGTSGFGPGQYILRVNNFAAGPEGDYDGTVTFQGPDPFRAGARSRAGRLTCEFPEGNVLHARHVTVERGERAKVDLSACAADDPGGLPERDRAAFAAGGSGPPPSGAPAAGSAPGSRTSGARGRRGIDSYCVTGGGTLRIGYPTGRLNRTIGRSLRPTGQAPGRPPAHLERALPAPRRARRGLARQGARRGCARRGA